MTQGISAWRGSGAWDAALAQTDAPAGGPPPVPLRTQAPGAVAPPADGRDGRIAARIDAFRVAMTAPYRTPEGLAWPGTTFQMARSYRDQATLVAKNAPFVVAAARAAGLSPAQLLAVRVGRGTPATIHAVTQALIDMGRMPVATTGPSTLEARVRAMAFAHGIGIDCAGYVQQALLATMEVDRTHAGLGSALNEDLSNLAARGWLRVPEPKALQPGDVGSLGPPPSEQVGHRVIVREQHLATPDELTDLGDLGADAAHFARDAPIRVIVVDSSWGCSGNPQTGGVRRETWWYSEATRLWAYRTQGLDSARTFKVSPEPFGHPATGAYGIFRRPERR